MKNNMVSYCNEMNKIISENKGNRIDLLNEVMEKVFAEGGELLWNRDVFISCNGNDKTMRDLVRYSDKVHFEPSDDPQEHPGVVVCFGNPQASDKTVGGQERELLLQVLCEMLRHKVVVSIDGYRDGVLMGIEGDRLVVSTEHGINYPVRLCKPYLRPVETMTDKEKDELWEAIDADTKIIMDNLDAAPIHSHKGKVYRGKLPNNERDFLIRNRFDYRGLIPIGLALPAPEGMYNTKTE